MLTAQQAGESATVVRARHAVIQAYERSLAIEPRQLDALVRQAGGAVNPYKDARMSPATFEASFPGWRDILPYRDPRISSGLWRRVTQERRPARKRGCGGAAETQSHQKR